MKKNILILSISLAVLSCEKTIEYEIPDEGQKLSITSTLTPNGADAAVGISKYALDNSTSTSLYALAEIFLFEGQTLVGQFNPRGDFGYLRYTLNQALDVDKIYTVKAYRPGYDTAFGSSFIPQRPTFELIDVDNQEGKIEFRINDPLITNDIYRIRLRYILDTDVNNYRFTTTDPTLEIYTNEEDDPLSLGDNERDARWAYLQDDLFSGGSKTITIDYFTRFLPPDASVFLEVTTLSVDRYEFLKSLDLLGPFDELNPFAEPIQVYNNINNGYGIVGGENSQRLRVFP